MAAVKTHRDLGVIFDSKMTFNPHIDNVVSSGRRMIGMMKRFGKGLSVRALITVYVSFVRPKLEYASIIWNSVGRVKSDKLETVQRDFLNTFHISITQTIAMLRMKITASFLFFLPSPKDEAILTCFFFLNR
jgi:hypothetical protein